MRKNLLMALGLALAWWLSAELGLALGAGLSGFTAVWPPAGIAVAALLIWGPRALPGLALGAIGTGILGFLEMPAGLTPATAGVALAGGLAALAQAGLAARLMPALPERLRAHPVRQTLRFAAVVAVCCTIAPLVYQGLLLRSGLLQPVELAFALLSAWVGEVTGALVFAPLLLLWLHPGLRRHRVAVQAYPILCLGLGLTLFCSFAVGIVTRDASIERFRADSDRLSLALKGHVATALRDLESLQHFFFKSTIEAREFRTVAMPLLARSPWQVGFAWLPRVSFGDRDAFETAADGLGGISIRELDPDGALVTAQVRAEYFPVTWIEPEAGQEALLSVDHAADALRGPALAKARDLDRVAATAPLSNLVHATDLRLVQTVYMPVVARDADVAAPYDPQKVRGVLAVTIDLAALLETAVRQMDVHGMRVLLFDTQATGAGAIALDADGGARDVDAQALAAQLGELTAGVNRQQVVDLGDRQWRLLSQPAWAARLPPPSWLQAAVAGSGLAFTALLTGFFILRRRRDEVLQQGRRELEQQVTLRTRDLADTNGRLRAEVDDHRRTGVLLQDATLRAEAANRAKSLFLANMSHEIRTPLNAVLGYTQLLIEDARLPADARERLRVIQVAGNRLLHLINDVLDLAKIEAGSLQTQREAMDLRHELAEIEALFAPRARAQGLALDFAVDLDQPQVLLGDRAKIGQIVMNLLGNALKFTDTGRITLRAWRTGDDTTIEVEDTGPGIAADELVELFTPFRQGQSGFDKGGSGLGLSLSRNMARAMGGELTVRSTFGQGTVVTLQLPLPLATVEAAPPPRQQGSRQLAPGTACEALVVEDDPSSRDVLASLLSRSGCRVTLAVDGEEGLAACRARAGRPFDIVFSDIRMPRLDGLEMMRRLRAEDGPRRLPLVAVSASSLEHERRYYIAQGFDDFVSKPYAFDLIYEMLARHAGARLVPAGEPAAADAPAAASAPAVPAAGPTAPGAAAQAVVPDAALHPQLRRLAEAAADGRIDHVRRRYAELAEALPPALRAQIETDLRQYDFDRLALRLNDCLRGLGEAGR